MFPVVPVFGEALKPAILIVNLVVVVFPGAGTVIVLSAVCVPVIVTIEPIEAYVGELPQP